MITEKRAYELMKEAEGDEKKFAQLVMKEDPKSFELTDEELDHIDGGGMMDGFKKWITGK